VHDSEEKRSTNSKFESRFDNHASHRSSFVISLVFLFVISSASIIYFHWLFSGACIKKVSCKSICNSIFVLLWSCTDGGGLVIHDWFVKWLDFDTIRNTCCCLCCESLLF